MDPASAASRRPQLPALTYLDIEKAKREEEAHQHRSSSASQGHHSAPTDSPSYQYSQVPTPSYTHGPPQHANKWPGTKAGVHTPPQSRRTSAEEHDYGKQTSCQSLPSISEALGVDSKTSYPQPSSTSQPPSQATHMSHSLPAAPSSPTAGARRPYGTDRPQPQNAYLSSSHQYPSFRHDSAGSHSYPPPDMKPEYVHSHDDRPSLRVQTARIPPRPDQHSHPQTTSPQYEQRSAHSAGPMGPPGPPYGYNSYHARFTQPTSSSQGAGPVYQPSSQHAAPQTPSSSWKPESTLSRFGTDERPSAPATYGDSVKRHLEFYDLEAALNEIGQSSSIMLDFSRRYGDRMHQTARSGPSLSTLPSVVEIEDMIAKARLQVDALTKIRGVVFTQQAAYELQLAEQRQQHKTFQEPPTSQPVVEYHSENGDGKGGFAGPETKKRRGRAAPPGRCHSCSRAETPEWRRGPDGARTLCNACGLHYAKMTRKLSAKNANVDSSNLRPKEA